METWRCVRRGYGRCVAGRGRSVGGGGRGEEEGAGGPGRGGAREEGGGRGSAAGTRLARCAQGEVTRGRLAGRAAAPGVLLASRGLHARRRPRARPGLEGGRAPRGGWASALCSPTSVKRRPTFLRTL